MCAGVISGEDIAEGISLFMVSSVGQYSSSDILSFSFIMKDSLQKPDCIPRQYKV
jgi:hypothetical protein